MKEVIPNKTDEVYQATEISRAAYSMPVMLRRVIGLAMARIRIDKVTDLSVSMTVGEALRALELNDSTTRYEELRAAFKGVMGQVVSIDTAEGWKMHPWFNGATYSKKEDSIELTFNESLRPYLLEFMKTYDVHAVSDLSKLQGRYSWRIYEMVMTYAGMAGKNGNKADEWYHPELTLAALRQLFVILDKQYKATAQFRIWVIDNPVREINEAGLGIFITPVYKRRGKILRGVEFHCKRISRTGPKNVSRITKTDRDDEDLKTRFKSKYEQYLAEELAQTHLDFISDDMYKVACENKALERIRKEQIPTKKEKPQKTAKKIVRGKR